MPNQIRSGARDLFQTKKNARVFFNFLFLQGRKPKLTKIIGTKIIFKLFRNKTNILRMNLEVTHLHKKKKKSTIKTLNLHGISLKAEFFFIIQCYYFYYY